MLGTENLYTAAQTRALDHCAIHDHGIPGSVLMSRAAQAAFRHLLELWPEPGRVQVLCGTGNNGGDGFLVADLAHKRGIEVTVFQVGDAAKIAGDALMARQQALANGVKIVPFGKELPVADGVIVEARGIVDQHAQWWRIDLRLRHDLRGAAGVRKVGNDDVRALPCRTQFGT